MKRPASRGITACLSAALVLASSGCSSNAGSGIPGDGPGAAQGISVDVSPTAASLFPQQSVSLSAAVTGSINTAVSWSVEGGAANGSVSTEDGYTALYTAPQATGVFRVVARSQADSSVSSSATITVQVSAPPPAGSGPMTTAHRTSGVAPLAVFFDAVTTSPSGSASPFSWNSGVYQPADMEGATWSWDFGDPGSGTWTQTGRSRNTGTGYAAAHVYENPGTYTVVLTQTDTSGTVRTYTQTITVSAFTGTTFYVAANGSDSNNGTSTSTPFQSVAKAMNTALAAAGPVRILFRRGDSFSTNGQWDITKPGPGIIGAYGTGNRPVITCSFDNGSGYNIFQPYGAGSDWRVMDLEMHPTSTSSSSGPAGPGVTVQGVNLLILRLKAVDWNDGIGWGDWTPIYSTPHDGMFIVESESTSPSGTYEAYVGGRRIALLGNYFHDTGSSHVLRVWQAHKGVISNNQCARPGGQRHALKLHGPELNDGRPETRWVTITDNVFRASGTSQWTVSMGSQSDIQAEADPVSHLQFERNIFTGSASLIADIETEASHTIFRNNIFDDTLSPSNVSFLYVQRNAYVPAPTDIRLYNNTTYRGVNATGSDAIFLQTSSEVTNLRVRNNLMSVPSTGSATLISGTGGAGWAADHNLLLSSALPNAAAGDFSVASGSPAVDAGATLQEIRSDFRGTARPIGNGVDVGAVESR